MDEIKINLENCYGIKKFEHVFHFSKSKIQIIYAPNGSMKSSFAKTMEDIQLDKLSIDRIFTDRKTHRSVLVDNRDISKDEIFVINRMQEVDFKAASTILANNQLKDEYDRINLKLIDTKNDFVKKLQPHFGVKENTIEQIIIEAFDMDLYSFIENNINNIEALISPEYTTIVYNEIFNEKVIKFLNEKSFNLKIKEYIEIYDRLVGNSTLLFKKGKFNHNNADNVKKSLKDNGFFMAEHKVKINNSEIGNIEDLENVINTEKEKVLNDPSLTLKFNEIDKALNANIELRNFRNYVENNQEIIKEFGDLEYFRRKLILNHIAIYKNEFILLGKLNKKTKTRRYEITVEARKEQKDWINVLNIFKNRFTVPFNIKIQNQDEVILNNVPASLIFTYNDGISEKDLGGMEINTTLSTGEQRVFYLLNIIFQIELRKKIDKDQLIIVDDIADSFDYKNKYAIIEYLKDIADFPRFKMIILTHNFDFYKSIKGRLSYNCNYNGNHIATKSISEVTLKLGEKKDIFPQLRDNFHVCEKTFVACIPFVRNLIEYTKGKDNVNYLSLTALLHIKPNNTEKNIRGTKEYKVSDVLSIYNEIFQKNNLISNSTKNVYDLIFEVAEKIINNAQTDNLLDITTKLCLSIAIRYKAEEYIISKISDGNFHENIWKKQTGEIVGQYKKEFVNNQKEIEIFDRVNLMTPENLHINSFMYEPLMDLSEDHLFKLYNDIKFM